MAALLLAGLWGCSPPPPLPKGQGGPLATPGLLSTPASGTSASSSPTSASQASSPVSGSGAAGLPLVAPTVETQTEPVSAQVTALARELTAGSSTEQDKALALYEWIARNIRYDIVAYHSGQLPDPSPDAVLANRMGVCEGYARLFIAMAQAVGLEAVMVPGYSKGFAPDESRAKPDHAWNAVRLDGKWTLLDVTWGAGHINSEKRFEAEFEKFWFMTPPEQFAATHLPVESKWQLLSPPLDQTTFWTRPSLSQAFFEFELALESHPKAEIESDGTLEIRLSSGRDTRLMAALYQNDAPLPDNHALVERQGRDFIISVRAPRPGDYRLIVFAGPPDSLKGRSAVTYELTARSGSEQVFPKTLRTFGDQQVRLISPRSGLRDGAATEMVIEAPGATDLMAVVNEEQHQFERVGGERFRLRIVAEGEAVGVFGCYDGSTRYDGLLEFPVDR